MSHIVTVEVEIRDLGCLERACRRLGLELVRDVSTFKSYQEGLSCQHKIRVHPEKKNAERAYEIGLQSNGKGGFNLAFDPFCRGLGLMDYVAADKGKQGVGKLIQGYGVEVARKRAKLEGFSVRESVSADGSIVLKLSK